MTAGTRATDEVCTRVQSVSPVLPAACLQVQYRNVAALERPGPPRERDAARRQHSVNSRRKPSTFVPRDSCLFGQETGTGFWSLLTGSACLASGMFVRHLKTVSWPKGSVVSRRMPRDCAARREPWSRPQWGRRPGSSYGWTHSEQIPKDLSRSG